MKEAKQMKNKQCHWKTGCSKTRGPGINTKISIQIIYLNFWSAILFKGLNPEISRCYAKKLRFFFFFVRNVATLAKQICLGVSKWLAWMYGGNHGNWLVVRSLGEGCSVGMCEADRGAHTHRRANDKPAVSLKSISYIIETTYYFQPSSGQGKRSPSQFGK